METNIILAGVGGQGILSISYVIDMASLAQGLNFKQAEVHGMSQRGGAVSSHLRVSDQPIYSDLVPRGRGTLVLSVEPLESLRYVDYLGPAGVLISGVDPFINIPDYPPVEAVLGRLSQLPQHQLIYAGRLAREAGSSRAQNMVLLGAASPYLGINEALLEDGIRQAFARKGEKIQTININAFRAGKAAGAAYQAALAAGLPPRWTRLLVGRLQGGVLEPGALPHWKALLGGPLGEPLLAALAGEGKGKLGGQATLPQGLLGQGSAAAGKLQELLA